MKVQKKHKVCWALSFICVKVQVKTATPTRAVYGMVGLHRYMSLGGSYNPEHPSPTFRGLFEHIKLHTNTHTHIHICIYINTPFYPCPQQLLHTDRKQGSGRVAQDCLLGLWLTVREEETLKAAAGLRLKPLSPDIKRIADIQDVSDGHVFNEEPTNEPKNRKRTTKYLETAHF